MKQFDVLVLGAGIVGISTALQLQNLGCSVVLADQAEPGEATSFGNAGIIERASVYPYAFPRDGRVLLRYLGNQQTDVHFQWSSVVRQASRLFQYWWHSAPSRHHASMLALQPLIERCLATHLEFVRAASAESLLYQHGWVKLARTDKTWQTLRADAEKIRPFGITATLWDNDQLHAQIPALQSAFVGGVHYSDPHCVRDPIDLSRAYVRLFKARGGHVVSADARQLQRQAGRWYQPCLSEHAVQAQQVVFCLGPWSEEVLARWGYQAPFFVKRGYHQEYALQGEHLLNMTLYDADGGYVLAPMQNGVRLTTGAQFMERDAPPRPIQVERAEGVARHVLQLGRALRAEPWMGSRPCLPDMRPLIGPLPGVDRAWLNCGHQHHGLTLGPVTGLLLAQMLTGARPFVATEPFAPTRFASR